MNPIFVHNDPYCPVVYVAGACLRSGTSSAEASFGVSWGWNHFRNMNGPVEGAQTEIRAELTAVKNVLEKAITERVTTLVIRSNSEKLCAEMEKWSTNRKAAENKDLLATIDELKIQAENNGYMFWIDDVLPNQIDGYDDALYLAEMRVDDDIARPDIPTDTTSIVAIYANERRHLMYGLFWSYGDEKNSGGAVEISRDNVEMFAVKELLKTAVTHKIRNLHIVTQSPTIETIIEALHTDPQQLEGNSRCLKSLLHECQDLVVKIPNITIECLPVHIENLRLTQAAELAMELPEDQRMSPSPNPVRDDEINESLAIGTHVVDIAAYAQEHLLPNVKAGCSTFWMEGDEMNWSGVTTGQQTRFRAFLTALRVALQTANINGYEHIIVRSKSPVVDAIFQNFTDRKWMHSFLNRGAHNDLRVPISELITKFKTAYHIYVPNDKNVMGQKEAEHLARRIAGVKIEEVSICGIGSSETDRLCRFALYYAKNDKRNEEGSSMNKMNDLCTEMLALRRAVELAKTRDVQDLVVYTKSESLEAFVNIWRYEWCSQNWMTLDGNPMKHATMYRQLYEDLSKMNVYVRSGKEGNVAEARKMAEESNKYYSVYTAGFCSLGNNEPIAGYGVYWGADDERNTRGAVPGAQSTTRARLMAVKTALETALDHRITRLEIKRDTRKIKEDEEQELIREIRALEKQMHHVKYTEFASPEAAELAHPRVV